MGLRDDIEDAPGKEPVTEQFKRLGIDAVYQISERADKTRRVALYWSCQHGISAPVEAALHDFALALDQAIKDHLNKVRIDD